MSIRSTISSRTTVAPCSSRHLQASNCRPICLSTNHRDRCHFLGDRSFLKSLVKVQNITKIKMDMVVNSVEPGTPPLPSDPSSGTSCNLWLVGMLFSVVLPFWKNKWWPLLKSEDVVEMLEKVAGEVEKVADDITDHVPEGKLQRAARIIENVAREAAKDATLADDLIEKVEDVEKEVDSVINQAIEKIEEANDTENQTTKIKDATEIKTKIAEIKQANDVKNEIIKT